MLAGESMGRNPSMKRGRFPVVVLPNTDDDMSGEIATDDTAIEPIRYATAEERAQAVRDGYAAPLPRAVDPASNCDWKAVRFPSCAGHYFWAEARWRAACDAEIAAIQAVQAAERELRQARRVLAKARWEMGNADRELAEEKARNGR
jgi:hypothetical protein